MRYDDRLATVLGLAAAASHERAVRWRQLVELVARGAGRNRPELQDAALQQIAASMREVPVDVRATTARVIAGRDLPPELVALFAADEIGVAAPVVSAAELSPAGWAAVRAVASPSVAAMLAALRPEGEAPPTADPSSPLRDAVQSSPPASPAAAARSEVIPPPTGLFRWECGPAGEVDWVEGAPRAALIGWSLAEIAGPSFDSRQPFEDQRVQLAADGPLAGEWRWTGEPAFDFGSGRFAGYRGTARREGGPAAAADPAGPGLDTVSLRELVHELRTPLNAIIGFGEIIEGQHLGPAHRPYRERAAGIVRQARSLAEAVEDLDFAARCQSDRYSPPLVEFGKVFAPLRLELLEQAARREVSLTVGSRGRVDRLAVEEGTSGRLLRRFLFPVIAAASPGERLQLTLEGRGEQVAVAIDRPQEVAGAASELEFILRLVRHIASMLGGDLQEEADRLVLLLAAARP